ncbi:hypothetical protein EDB83DRAFT_2648322 [Lactarius deliciosus]|nr:hypothetical protein EDB83DRAFT_2648322 [Lactarius deliciosus]
MSPLWATLRRHCGHAEPGTDPLPPAQAKLLHSQCPSLLTIPIPFVLEWPIRFKPSFSSDSQGISASSPDEDATSPSGGDQVTRRRSRLEGSAAYKASEVAGDEHRKEIFREYGVNPRVWHVRSFGCRPAGSRGIEKTGLVTNDAFASRSQLPCSRRLCPWVENCLGKASCLDVISHPNEFVNERGSAWGVVGCNWMIVFVDKFGCRPQYGSTNSPFMKLRLFSLPFVGEDRNRRLYRVFVVINGGVSLEAPMNFSGVTATFSSTLLLVWSAQANCVQRAASSRRRVSQTCSEVRIKANWSITQINLARPTKHQDRAKGSGCPFRAKRGALDWHQ